MKLAVVWADLARTQYLDSLLQMEKSASQLQQYSP